MALPQTDSWPQFLFGACQPFKCIAECIPTYPQQGTVSLLALTPASSNTIVSVGSLVMVTCPCCAFRALAAHKCRVATRTLAASRVSRVLQFKLTHGFTAPAGPSPSLLPAPQALSTAFTDSADAVVAAMHTHGLRCPLCGMHSTLAAALCAHILSCHRGARVGFEVCREAPNALTMRLMPGGASMRHDNERRPRDSTQNYGIWVCSHSSAC